MKYSLITALFFALLFPYGFSSPLHAELFELCGGYYESSGKYYVEEDENGVCLRTDQGVSWYLSGDDLGAFKPGDSGLYYFEKEVRRPYILTDKKRVFYINQEVPKSLDKERSSSDADTEPIEVIKGFDRLYDSSSGGLYATKDEARRGVKGQATIDWERKKAEEAARLAEEEARRKAEEEARRQRALLEEAVATAQEALEEAAESRRIAEEARQEAEEESRKGRIGFGIDASTGMGGPVFIPPRHKKKRGKYEFRLDDY